jgi:hypothetical protein
MIDLYTFIGLDDNGDHKIYVSPFKLNHLSDMHERDESFPAGVKGAIPEEKCVEALHKIRKYYDDNEKGRTKKRKTA